MALTAEETEEFLSFMAGLDYRWESDVALNHMQLVVDVPKWAADRWPDEIKDYVDTLSRHAEQHLGFAVHQVREMDFNEVRLSDGTLMRLGPSREPVFYDERKVFCGEPPREEGP